MSTSPLLPAAASLPSQALRPLCPLGLSLKSAHKPCAYPRGFFTPDFASCQHGRDRSEPPGMLLQTESQGAGVSSPGRAGMKIAAPSPVLPLSAVQPMHGVPGLGLCRSLATGMNGPVPAPGSSWSQREEGMQVNRYQDSGGTQQRALGIVSPL